MCNCCLDITVFVQPVIHKHCLVSNCKVCSRCIIFLYYMYLRMVSSLKKQNKKTKKQTRKVSVNMG